VPASNGSSNDPTTRIPGTPSPNGHGAQAQGPVGPGSPNEKQAQLDAFRVNDEGTLYTTDQGVKVDDTDNSLTAGVRGPSLIEDFHFREKMTHFDHERIPERVVHARGTGAHGYFECTDSLADVTTAAFLTEVGRRTPVFTRFSTVGGSRGSADTVRDVRGFATKFYTSEGNFDLVGNNIPVFFIQDAVKFPDFVHAVKPEPHNEIPQASSAHDSFWDFISLQTESAHMIMWLMSDRALPRSYRMMQGFGVHTFRFVDAAGKGTFVKFHWRPRLGTHALDWDETQKIAGKDPDFNRRDLWENIEAGNYPEWDLAVQLVPEEREMDFDFDLLDATKIIPEEQVPLRVVGRMVLDHNTNNFFAETEQVAFHLSNLPPGIDVTNDPLLQGRLFSYLDTQLLRLGGPNFSQIPINRPVVEVHNVNQDGFHQHRILTNQANYSPNTLGGGCPAIATAEQGAYRHYTQPVAGEVIKQRSPSFADHFSQAQLFWNSMSPYEQHHIIDAFSFELGKVNRAEIRQRVLERILANVDPRLTTEVAAKLGMQAPTATTENSGATSPALSLAEQPSSAATRKVAVLAADGVEASSLQVALAPLRDAGAVVEILAPHAGELSTDDGGRLPVDRRIATMSSVLYDAVMVADGEASVRALLEDGEAIHYVAEAYRHAKPVGALGDGIALVKAAPLPEARFADSPAEGVVAYEGLVTRHLDPSGADGGRQVGEFGEAFLEAVAGGRWFGRSVGKVPA
jgi:catalase